MVLKMGNSNRKRRKALSLCEDKDSLHYAIWHDYSISKLKFSSVSTYTLSKVLFPEKSKLCPDGAEVPSDVKFTVFEIWFNSIKDNNKICSSPGGIYMGSHWPNRTFHLLPGLLDILLVVKNHTYVAKDLSSYIKKMLTYDWQDVHFAFDNAVYIFL